MRNETRNKPRLNKFQCHVFFFSLHKNDHIWFDENENKLHVGKNNLINNIIKTNNKRSLAKIRFLRFKVFYSLN